MSKRKHHGVTTGFGIGPGGAPTLAATLGVVVLQWQVIHGDEDRGPATRR